LNEPLGDLFVRNCLWHLKSLLVAIGFLNDLFYGRSYIAAPAELSIPFLLDEKSTVVPVRLAGEQSGGKRKVSYGDARSNSERAAPSIAFRDELSVGDAQWSEAVAVGSLAFVEKVKSELEFEAVHRQVIFRFDC
jgi:hypothetical protein